MTFSIIVPVYNVAPYLRECLDSVLAQTCGDWECVCVDDGSTDGSGSILDEYAGMDNRFRVIHQRNSGVSAARNAALDVARGEYGWFVDADDMIRINALAFVRETLDRCPDVGLLAFDEFLLGETISNWPPLESPPLYFNSHGAREYIAFHKGACNVVFSRSQLGQSRMEHFSVGEDLLFFAELFWRTKHVMVVHAALYFYRQRATSVSLGKVNLEVVRENLEVERRCLGLIKEHRSEWCDHDFELYFQDNGWYLIATHMAKFLRISNAERTKVLPLWIAVQRLSLELGARRRYLRTTVAVLSLVPSGRLAWYLVSIIRWSRGKGFLGFCSTVVHSVWRRLGG